MIEHDSVSMPRTSIALDYASGGSRMPPSESLRSVGFWMIVISGGIGISILLLYAVTRVESLALAGFLWLYAGALMTLIAFVLGVVYASVAYARNFPPPSSRKRAAMAILMPILNCVLAFVCVAAGIALMD